MRTQIHKANKATKSRDCAGCGRSIEPGEAVVEVHRDAIYCTTSTSKAEPCAISVDMMSLLFGDDQFDLEMHDQLDLGLLDLLDG